MKESLKKFISLEKRKKIFNFLNHLWCALCRLVPVKKRVFFYTIRADGKLLENSRMVYDALDCKKVIFARKLPHSQLDKPKIYYYLLTSKVIVTDDYLRYMRAVKLRPSQKLIQIWHAGGAFKSFGLDAPSKLTKKDELDTHSQYSAVVVTGEECRKFFAGAFGVSEDICLPLGLPRTDKLFAEKDKMRAAVFERHPEFAGKKLYLFCPTFREKKGGRIKYDPEINWDEMSASLDADEIFIIRRHPVMDYPLIEKEYGNIVDLSDESTLELTAAADVMITDYSSVSHDAALLDVPMVFYCPDHAEYEREFYLKFPDDLPGEMVTLSAELLESIRRAKKDPPLDRIEKFRLGQVGACDGHSTERVAALIKSWL